MKATKFLNLKTLQRRIYKQKGGDLNLADLPHPTVILYSLLYNIDSEKPKLSKAKKKLKASDFEKFLTENEDKLVAVEYNEAFDSDHYKGITVMLKVLGPDFAKNYTMIYFRDYVSLIKNEVQNTYAAFYYMIEIQNKQYLLFRKTMANITTLRATTFTDDQKKIIIYRVATKLYSILYLIIKSKCFHRNITESSLYINARKIRNGQFDIELFIGDFSLFVKYNKTDDLVNSRDVICSKKLARYFRDDVCIQDGSQSEIVHENINILWESFTYNLIIYQILNYLKYLNYSSDTFGNISISEYIRSLLSKIKTLNIEDQNEIINFENYIIQPLDIKSWFLTLDSAENGKLTFIDFIAIDSLYTFYESFNMSPATNEFFNLKKAGITMENTPELYLLCLHFDGIKEDVANYLLHKFKEQLPEYKL